MRLFLSDTFFDAVMQLPKDAQKRVVDFQKKFRQNSTSASLHFGTYYTVQGFFIAYCEGK